MDAEAFCGEGCGRGSSEMHSMAEEKFTDKRHLVLDEFVEEKRELKINEKTRRRRECSL
jgi:hypothetical protein